MRWLTKYTHDVSSYISDGLASGIMHATSIRSSAMSYNNSCAEHGLQTDDSELTTLNNNLGKIANLLSQRMTFDSVVTYTVNVPNYLRTSVDDTTKVLIECFDRNHTTVERLLSAMSNEIASVLSRKSVLCDHNVSIESVIHAIVTEHRQIIQRVSPIDNATLDSIRERVSSEHKVNGQ